MVTKTTKKSKKVSLKNWSQKLRPYQKEAVAKALAVKAGGKLLLSAPTGTGKGTMQLALLCALRAKGKRAWIVTPSLEVMRGYLERCGAGPDVLDGGSGALAKAGQAIFCTTPVRMRNKLKSGKRSAPDVLIIDEAHHATDDTIAGGGLQELCPNAARVGFTATPYRGNPEETAELLSCWGNVEHVLTIPQAIENGAWALPKWHVEPIVDDDLCKTIAGDIDADEVTVDASAQLARFIKTLDLKLPSCVTVGSVRAANALRAALEVEGVATTLVLGDTPTTERSAAYTLCSEGGTLLVSVKVLGEGVDLPWLRRWIDASPTLSPVCFLQKLGRVTRPHASGQPEYIGTNRNLERHGYLLQGSLPKAVIREAQERMGGGTKRKTKKLGMIKGVTKLKPIELPLADGGTALMYACWCPATLGGSGFERCLIIDAENDHAFSAVRNVDPSKETPEERWGPWTRETKIPTTVVGFKASKLGGKPTRAMENAWAKDATNRGLDGNKAITRAQYYALPVLAALKTSIRPDGSTLRAEKVNKKAQAAADVLAGVPAVEDKIADGLYTVYGYAQYRLLTQATDSTFAPGRQVLAKRLPNNDWENVAFVDGKQIKVWSRFLNEETKLTSHFHVLCADVAAKEEDENFVPDVTLSNGNAHGPKHETAAEGNIPLMVRLLKEGKDMNEIEAIYVARYKSEGKDVSFAHERVRIYRKIARKQIDKEEKAARLERLGF